MWYTDRLWEHETIYRLLTQCSIHVFVRGKPRGLETHWSEKLVAMAHHDRNHGARQLHDKLRNKSLFKPVPLKKAFESRPDEPTAGWSSSRQLFVLVAVSSSDWRILRETDPPPAIMEGDFGTSKRIVDFPLNKIKETLCNTPTVCSKTSQMLENHVSPLWDVALLYFYLFKIGFPWSSHRKRKGHDPLWARPPKARAGRNVNEEPKFVQGCVSYGTPNRRCVSISLSSLQWY